MNVEAVNWRPSTPSIKTMSSKRSVRPAKTRCVILKSEIGKFLAAVLYRPMKNISLFQRLEAKRNFVEPIVHTPAQPHAG